MLNLRSIRGYLDDIRNAKENNTLAIFVGAGITRRSERDGVKVPLWSDLINDLKAELDDCVEEDFLKIAELYYLKHGNKHYVSKIRNSIPSNIRPSNIHKLILGLNPQVIITTNWDNLFEQAIEENGYFYDVIACDKDLGASFLPKKLIKMHGDFSHHNFVFKESDYINYRDNFPLIENYVKSILSSSTVLFLGYSFNDYNLKQILAWINRRTTSTPNLYIVQTSDNRWEGKYLESHKLIPITVPNDGLCEFLNEIYNRTDYDDVTPEIYVFSKLSHLELFHSIYYKDIETALGNKFIVNIYGNISLLRFVRPLETHDSDPNETILYEKFIKEVERLDIAGEKSVNGKVFRRIYAILSKANINGINYRTDGSRIGYFKIPAECISDNRWIKAYLDFNFFEPKALNDKSGPLKSAIIAYNLRDYKSAHAIIKNAIGSFLKEKDFFWAFISMVNNNNLNILIKYGIIDENVQIEEYNLKDKVSNLSQEWRKKIEPIYNLANFSLYYKIIEMGLNVFLNKEAAVKFIKKGGSHWENNPESYRLWHKSLLNFVIGNFLLVENYREFISSIELFLKTTIIRSETMKTIRLNKYEIFSAIKYFDNKKVSSLFEGCFVKEGSSDYIKLKLEDGVDKNWLNKIFSTLCRTYTDISSFEGKRVIERYFQNTLFFASLIELNDDDISAIHGSIINTIKNNNVTLAIINSIASFITNQYSLYNKIYPDEMMIEILTIFLKKFSIGNFNGHEALALENNNFYVIFNLLQNGKLKRFEDAKLIKSAIEKFNSLDNNDSDIKSRLIIYLFFPLYSISSKGIKDILKEAIEAYEAKNKYYQIRINLDSIILFNILEGQEGMDLGFKEEEIINLIEDTRALMKSEKCSLLFDIGYSFMQLNSLIKHRKIKSKISKKIKMLISEIKRISKEMKFPSQI